MHCFKSGQRSCYGVICDNEVCPHATGNWPHGENGYIYVYLNSCWNPMFTVGHLWLFFHRCLSLLWQQSNPLSVSSFWWCHSLETAKSTAQAATMATPVDLNMAFTQPASPATSPGPTLATMSALTPAHVLGTPYSAIPLSGLLGMKSIPFLTLSSPTPTGAVTAAPSTLAAYTTKISTANCIKKPERQKFAPYWECLKDKQAALSPSHSHSRWQNHGTFTLWSTNREETNGDELKVIYGSRRFLSFL